MQSATKQKVIFSVLQFGRANHTKSYIPGSIMSRCNYSEFTAKQEYVRTHLDKFGCKDNGSSLDDREIYVISEQAMGLQPLDSNNSN